MVIFDRVPRVAAGAVASSRRRLALAAAGVAAGAALLAMAGSWIPSLWGDEAASVLSATRPVPSLLTMILHIDIVHAAYYLALHAWVGLFGSSPFSVRFPSALAIGVCAAAITWMCGRAATLGFGVLAGSLAAILPRLTYAGEEARSYAFDAALAAILCALVVEMVLRGPTRGRWIAYTVVLTVAIYVFLYLALLTLAVGAAVAVIPVLRSQVRRWILASAAASVLALPLVAVAVTQTAQIGYLRKGDPAGPAPVLVQMWFSTPVFAVIAWSLIGVAAAGLTRDVVVRHSPVGPIAALEILALCWLIIPMGILVAAAPIMAGYTARYGTYAAPAAAVLMASGIRRLAQLPLRRGAGPVIATVAVTAVVAAAAPVWASQRTPFAKNQSDWDQIAEVIGSRARPGDAIVFDDGTRPSWRPRLAMDTDPAPFAAVNDVTLAVPYPYQDTWYDATMPVDVAARDGRFDGVRRVWLVEYRIGDAVDTWGVAALHRLGFRERQQILDHRSVIALYTP
jgi:mannosyltransferase